jgi:hypothetical protein
MNVQLLVVAIALSLSGKFTPGFRLHKCAVFRNLCSSNVQTTNFFGAPADNSSKQ